MYRLQSTAAMYRLSAPVSRIATRRAVAQPKRRTLATTTPPPPTDKKDMVAAASGNAALLIGGVAALGAIAWYMTRNREEPGPPSTGDVGRQVRELRDTAQAKGKADLHDAKSKTQEEYDRARSGAEGIVDKTRSAAHDLRLSAEQRASSARDAVVGKGEDVKREGEREVQKAKDTGNSWFSWSKGKAEDTKEDAAKGVARRAENVRVEADKRA